MDIDGKLDLQLIEANEEQAINQIKTEEKDVSRMKQTANALLTAFLMILESVKIKRNHTQVAAKQVQANMNAENVLFEKEADLNFTQMMQSYDPHSRGFDQELLTNSQEIKAMRADLETSVSSLNQNIGASNSWIKTSADNAEQNLAKILPMLGALAKHFEKR